MTVWQALSDSHGGFAPPWRSLVLAGIATAFYCLAGPAPEAWVYDRTAIANGEWWRLLSGHFVHGDGQHAFWDIAGVVLVGALLEPRLGRWWFPVLGGGLLAVDAWLWWGMSELVRYCGLSGVLNGILAAGLYRLWHEHRDPLVMLVGAAALSKILLEITIGQALFTDTLWPSLPVVHAAGWAGGLVIAWAGGSGNRPPRNVIGYLTWTGPTEHRRLP